MPTRSDVETWLEASGFIVMCSSPVPFGQSKVLIKVPMAQMFECLTPQQARALGEWLSQAADMAEVE